MHRAERWCPISRTNGIDGYKKDFMLYPIGIQNFEDLRKGGYIYVDKTELIQRLVSTGKYYFPEPPETLREKSSHVHH